MIIACFWLLMASSFFVIREPAPFDLAFIALFSLSMFFGLRVPKRLVFLILLLGGFLLFGLIGTSQSSTAEHYQGSIRHVQITGLLVAVALFVACFIYRYGERALTALMNGWVFAALLAALTGIAGYFDLLGSYSDAFTLYGRAKGTFKDPNVLAPFLVPPALYCVYHAASRSAFWSLINLAILLILVLGLFLSFSRGGWAHFAVSALIAVMLWLVFVEDRRFNGRLIAFTILAGGVLTFALLSLLGLDSVGDLFAQRFRIQDYDSSASGRFAGQLLTAAKVLDYPLGLGSHGFLPEWFEQPHNVYLFQFVIGGWGGGFVYLTIVGATLVRGMGLLNRKTPLAGVIVVLVASFAGLALEGLIVDSDHWRHFYFLMGAIWGLVAIYETPARYPVPVRVDAPPEPPSAPPPRPFARSVQPETYSTEPDGPFQRTPVAPPPQAGARPYPADTKPPSPRAVAPDPAPAERSCPSSLLPPSPAPAPELLGLRGTVD
ncbi:MAG: O-antigen ligase family protein [Hyphomicrobiales bacterium]